MSEAPRIPVTVIGGYLGAGKTTLVNHLLRTAQGRRLAVLVNDLGELSIDADLIEARDENLISIAGGCVCCSYGSDLVLALKELAARSPRPDHVLIETSGVALPNSVAASLSLLAGYKLDCVAVLADVTTIRRMASDRYLADTIERQFADADFVLAAKVDCVPAGEAAAVCVWLSQKAPQARVLQVTRGRVPFEVIAGCDRPSRSVASTDHQHHETGFYATRVLDFPEPVDATRVALALADRGVGLLRAKGFVRGHDGATWTVQVVGERGEAEPARKPTSHVGRVNCIGLIARMDDERLDAIAKSK